MAYSEEFSAFHSNKATFNHTESYTHLYAYLFYSTSHWQTNVCIKYDFKICIVLCLTGRSEQKYSPRKRRTWSTPWCAHHPLSRSCGYVKTTSFVSFVQLFVLEKAKQTKFTYNRSRFKMVFKHCTIYLCFMIYVYDIISTIDISKGWYFEMFRFIWIKINIL